MSDTPEKASPDLNRALRRTKEYLDLERVHGDRERITSDEIAGVLARALVRESGLVCEGCEADPAAPEASPEAWTLRLAPADQTQILAIRCPRCPPAEAVG
jgi:hypothetical protein